MCYSAAVPVTCWTKTPIRLRVAASCRTWSKHSPGQPSSPAKYCSQKPQPVQQHWQILLPRKWGFPEHSNKAKLLLNQGLSKRHVQSEMKNYWGKTSQMMTFSFFVIYCCFCGLKHPRVNVHCGKGRLSRTLTTRLFCYGTPTQDSSEGLQYLLKEMYGGIYGDCLMPKIRGQIHIHFFFYKCLFVFLRYRYLRYLSDIGQALQNKLPLDFCGGLCVI